MAQQEKPDWRKIAADTQEALSVASRRHTEALERLGSLRVGLATVLRRAYPAHVQGVEKALGGHLSDLPDSVLMGYLEAFAMMSRSGRVTTPNDLQEIARALRDSGFPMEPDATAVDMAVAIRGGFSAAKYDNQKQRRRNRGKNAKNSGTEAIRRDLAWAATQAEAAGTDAAVEKKAKAPTKKMYTDEGTVAPSEHREPTAPEERTSPLPQDEMDAIKASLMQPAPRFMRDVVAVAGDVDKAAMWQEFQKDMGNFSFIKPQAKHRQRGALLIPSEKVRAAIANYSTSPWGRALAQKYPAGRTFDLAVVMSKLHDKIVAVSFTKTTAEITYRTSHGIKALIVGLAAGADPWLDVEEGVNRLLQVDSLQEILVVTCPAKANETVVQTLRSAASDRKWVMTMPVNVEDLGDWLNDEGRSSTTIPAG